MAQKFVRKSWNFERVSYFSTPTSVTKRVLNTMNNQGVEQDSLQSIMWDTYMRAGEQALRLKNVTEAERMFAIAYERSNEFELNDLRRLETMRQIVTCYMHRGQYHRAEEFLMPLMSSLFAQFGSDSDEMLGAMKILAEIHTKQDKFKDAAHVTKYLLDHHPARNNPHDPEIQELKKEYNVLRWKCTSDYEYDQMWLH
jgi:tetratricopeptide (TPR) repeat protein